MPTVRFASDLSKSECLERLRKIAGPRSDRGWFDMSFPAQNDPVFIWVRGDRIKIARASGGPQQNSFRRLFDGKVVEHYRGALIEVRFRLPRFVALFMAVWFGAYLYAIGLITVSVASRAIGHPIGLPLNDNAGPMVLLVPVLMLFGVVLVRSGIHMARAGEEEVVHFITSTLAASMIPSGDQRS